MTQTGTRDRGLGGWPQGGLPVEAGLALGPETAGPGREMIRAVVGWRGPSSRSSQPEHKQTQSGAAGTGSRVQASLRSEAKVRYHNWGQACGGHQVSVGPRRKQILVQLALVKSQFLLCLPALPQACPISLPSRFLVPLSFVSMGVFFLSALRDGANAMGGIVAKTMSSWYPAQCLAYVGTQ